MNAAYCVTRTVVLLGLICALTSTILSACHKSPPAAQETIPRGARPLGQPGKGGLEQTGGRPRDFIPATPPASSDPGARHKASPGNQTDAGGRPILMGE
jgi:hypothetical protein